MTMDAEIKWIARNRRAFFVSSDQRKHRTSSHIFPFWESSIVSVGFGYLPCGSLQTNQRAWCTCSYFLLQSISKEQAKRFTKFKERRGLIEKDVVCRRLSHLFIHSICVSSDELRKPFTLNYLSPSLSVFEGKDWQITLILWWGWQPKCESITWHTANILVLQLWPGLLSGMSHCRWLYV